MSALFVMPPGGLAPVFSEHLGAAFLRTVLAAAGLRAEQYLPAGNPSLPRFARFLRERRPAAVGFTLYEANLRACRAMARAAREALPEAVLMVGGPMATFSPEETLALVPADLCMRGAGEGTIATIVGAILGAQQARRRLTELMAEIPNLVLRTPAGAHRTRAGDLSSFPGEHFRSLDDLPSPYQAGLLASPDAGLLTSRGCDQHCTYCSFAEISGRRVRYHSVERVLEDVAALKALAARVDRWSAAVHVFDDAFSLAPGRARALCEGIVRRGLQLPFSCLTRADRVDPELLRLMRRAGFTRIGFGLESGVPRVLRAIGKVSAPRTRRDPGLEAEADYLERFRRAVAWAREAGLVVTVSVIGGLAAETAEDFRDTLAFVDALRVPSYTHNTLRLFPGTPLYRDRARHGLEAGRDPATREWRTWHAYDVRAVAPLPGSSLHAERWEEAHELSDALCGWPRPDRAGPDAAWAVVLHGAVPAPALAAWLPRVLAIHGAILVIGAEGALGPAERATWLALLAGADVPWGRFALLRREARAGGGFRLRPVGGLGEHRLEVSQAWPAGPRAVQADRAGNCRVQLWAGQGGAPPPSGDAAAGLSAPSPQIVDACRWSPGDRRCRRPRVLHVWPGGEVTPCWRGAILGKVGDSYGALARRARAALVAAGAAGGCPAAHARGGAGEGGVVETWELASQLAWLLRPGLGQAERQLFTRG